MDDLVITGNNKKILHKMIIRIQKVLGKMRLRLKNNYQVIKFIYTNKKGKTTGRVIDFMGFVFKRTHTVIRRSIMLRATRFAFRLYKRSVISTKQAQSMMSRIGWFKHTETTHVWLNYISPYISVKALKIIISKHQRRMNEYEDRLDKRAFQFATAGI